jgi:hypothetical protein
MFDLKKFIGLIGVENRLMQLFYDKAEAAGLNPTFDVYHVLAGDERPSEKEIAIMEDIFMFHIKGSPYQKLYETADVDFHEKIATRNAERSQLRRDNKHLNN